ncbi:MAG: AmmeMemoRadiSam system radical SAM enzyme [Candidatus Bathyarchaeia archaeon]
MDSLPNYPTVRKSIFYEELGGGTVKCVLCERKCVVRDNQLGFCKTRGNFGGKLYTLVYGDISAVESRPIEIKPLFHYWPGSTALTFSTWSCNFDCVWCQNFHLSRTSPKPDRAAFNPPEKLVSLALENGDAGLCASFQEPTLLTDWAVEAFRLGKHMGIKYCCYVSNGYMTLEALRVLREAGMDGLKIDVKGSREVYVRYCGGADVETVWRNAREAKQMGIHVEIVNLVVNGVNDSEDALKGVIEKCLENLGPDTPLHFTRYFPAYKFYNPPTKIETLEKAYQMAKKAGVLYPYIGNVAGHRYEHTYCPNCGKTLIRRCNHHVLDYAVIDGNKCPKCGFQIPITGKYLGWQH